MSSVHDHAPFVVDVQLFDRNFSSLFVFMLVEHKKSQMRRMKTISAWFKCSKAIVLLAKQESFGQ